MNGVVQTNATLGSLSIPTGLINPPKASTQIQLALNLNATGGLPSSADSQQSGTGIGATDPIKGGTTIAFTDGTNAFTYTAAAAGTDTLQTLVNAISANMSASWDS